ncbi:hypothetical protein [Zavarzinella formosa]|uniref:hypothetical protein n=1 Tax=Zavarzinella formosa TaxID=360055 RepID=UPI0002E9684F|nr:hypothetical protein [Zavarzinella formosa]
MSIVRIGLAETKDFAEGYDAIFGKKTATEKPKTEPEAKSDAKTDDDKTKEPAK